MFHIDVLIPVPYRGVPFLNTLEPLCHQKPNLIQLYIVEGPKLEAGETRLDLIVKNRNSLHSYGIAPFIFTLDSDTVIPYNTFTPLIDELNKNEHLGAIGLHTEGENENHIGGAAMMWKREVFQRVRFRYEKDECECISMVKDVRKMGYKIHYYSKVKLEAQHLQYR